MLIRLSALFIVFCGVFAGLLFLASIVGLI
ncbi:hypothetical protein BJ994_000551 [Arthrobacter pigmenti]|uniref:Uncharacterized protein n=1 Tax=Arthrobacter pigmenti TaxID=271432 RepID=A0A846RNW6_9MICC|nr:hypothetical protein [Arthrobacter pigmenti]